MKAIEPTGELAIVERQLNERFAGHVDQLSATFLTPETLHIRARPRAPMWMKMLIGSHVFCSAVECSSHDCATADFCVRKMVIDDDQDDDHPVEFEPREMALRVAAICQQQRIP